MLQTVMMVQHMLSDVPHWYFAYFSEPIHNFVKREPWSAFYRQLNLLKSAVGSPYSKCSVFLVYRILLLFHGDSFNLYLFHVSGFVIFRMGLGRQYIGEKYRDDLLVVVFFVLR